MLLVVCLSLLLTACSGGQTTVSPDSTPAALQTGFVSRLTENGSGIVREVPAVKPMGHAVRNRFGQSDTGVPELDIRWVDCKEELSDKQRETVASSAPYITFNSDSVFPDGMPEAYDPAAILEAGKNPGLGVRALHEKGITGKGVGIAIIDMPLYNSHPEYKDSLALYEEIHVLPSEGAQMHGSAVASIAVGKSCGVAPGAKLYYWGIDFSKQDGSNSAEDEHIAFADGAAAALDRIIEVNKGLPKDEKIRVVSMSRGFSQLDDPGVKTFLAAVERAKKAGIFVLTTSNYEYYDWIKQSTDFGGLGKLDYAGSADDLPNYTLGRFEQRDPAFCSSRLLVPMDARTTADFTGDGYVFYCNGGLSWAEPYVAGLYALACQVKPDVTPEEFYKTVCKTADSLAVKIPADTGKDYTFRVVNPAKLMDVLKTK